MRLVNLLSLLLVAGLSPCTLTGNDRPALLARFGQSVARVQLESSFQLEINGRKVPRSRSLDVLGTVLSPAGMIAVSLSQIQPPALNGPSGPVAVSDFAFKDVLLKFVGRPPVPGRLVKTYPDNDLAFFTPSVTEYPGSSLPSLQIGVDSPPLSLSEDYYLLGVTAGGVSWIRTVEVMNVPSDTTSTPILLSAGSPGAPVFNQAGKLMGLCLKHARLTPADGFSLTPVADLRADVNAAAALR